MIEVKGLTKKYGDFKAVDNISFKINKGEIVGFLGPNGAGKSTTMNIITGFIEETDGKVIINNLPKSLKTRKFIGYMPENAPLYEDLTVKEYIKFIAELKRTKLERKKVEKDKFKKTKLEYKSKNTKYILNQEIKELIEKMGLKNVQNRLIKNLSRGYKQRVSLAGALVGNPDILILDEPTIGLDPEQIIEIRNLIKQLGKERTVLLSSHILSEVSQICDKVIIINKGKIAKIDTIENIEKNGSLEDEFMNVIKKEDE